ncbi:MAG TPA: hypothetical protein V6C81_02965 [Planktothrix sp.]|jgi:hypothetical protein
MVIIDEAALKAVAELTQNSRTIGALEAGLSKEALINEALGTFRPLWSRAVHAIECAVETAPSHSEELDGSFGEFPLTLPKDEEDRLKHVFVRNLVFKLAETAPVIRDVVGNRAYNVVEIGSSIDITLPKLLGPRCASYASLELENSASLTSSWRALMDKFGVNSAGKFRVTGTAAELPFASNSQDMVFGSYTPPLAFHGGNTELYESFASEASRILRPGGTLISVPTNAESQVAGKPILSKYFATGYEHRPSKQDLVLMRETALRYGGSYVPQLSNSLVAIK